MAYEVSAAFVYCRARDGAGAGLEGFGKPYGKSWLADVQRLMAGVMKNACLFCKSINFDGILRMVCSLLSKVPF
jgi:hypothetical protein